MSVSTTPAYISTVSEGHVVSVPIEVPIGARVAILLLPPSNDEEEAGRRARFEHGFAAIRAAIAAGYTTPAVADEDLDEKIRRAILLRACSCLLL